MTARHPAETAAETAETAASAWLRLTGWADRAARRPEFGSSSGSRETEDLVKVANEQLKLTAGAARRTGL